MTDKQPEALRLAELLETTDQMNSNADVSSQEVADALRRLHAANIDCVNRFDALMAERNELVKAYRKMYNSAAGYSNYCEDNANTRRCERDFEEAEAIFRAARAAIARATGETTKEGARG